jgi:16S rRNA (guanine527-N7)-methyltransferase
MTSAANYSHELKSTLSKLKLAVDADNQVKMLAYLDLLAKWNKSYNLTAITIMAEMISHHLMDSLSIAPYLQGSRILDIGTGAGFPGVPLALAFPNFEFVLLDSNGKKLRFIRQALATLAIKNVSLVEARMESFHDPLGFDDIISRAVCSVELLYHQSNQLLRDNGQWLVMKGIYPAAELKSINLPYQVAKLEVPGLNAERHLVILKEN